MTAKNYGENKKKKKGRELFAARYLLQDLLQAGVINDDSIPIYVVRDVLV